MGIRGRVQIIAVAVVVAVFATPAASASAAPTDYAGTALNILPAGQYGSLPIPPNADVQAQMYDNLTPLFDQVGAGDLTTYFKSEGLGVGPDGPGTEEPVPRPGVTIIRDKFNVPHVTAQTYDDGIWAAGGSQPPTAPAARAGPYNARVAAVDVPGTTALSLISSLQSFTPSPELEAELAKQTDVLLASRPGGRGRAARHRHLHPGDQRVDGDQHPLRRAVDAQRRLRAQRPQGPVPRPGRRRGGSALRSSSPA